MLSTGLGLSPNDVEEMYVDLAERQIDYWADHPPTHIIQGAKIGITGKARSASKPLSGADLAKQFGGRVVKRG